MPPVQIPWPLSALPGRRPGDGQGDLLNVFASKQGDQISIRRVGGIVPWKDVPQLIPRGIHAMANYLIHSWEGLVYVVKADGTQAATTGTGVAAGSGRVTIASNQRDTPDVVIVTESDVFLLDPATGVMSLYPDADLGIVTSVEYYAGYFLFTKDPGRIIASDLQNSAINPLSFVSAEYNPDKLLRIKNGGTAAFAFGEKSIEVWTDVGSSPFPLARQTNIDVGLLGKWCVAGGANEWEHGLMFIAADYTVRAIEGYRTSIVSNDRVSSDIYAYRKTPDDLNCTVYGFGQWSVFSITSPTWTWEYVVNTGQWHRRASHQAPTWNGRFGANWRGTWYVMGPWKATPADEAPLGRIAEVSLDVFSELDNPMVAVVESAPIKEFPANMRIPSVDVDVAVGVAGPGFGDPSLQLSWSHDGGASWANPLIRNLGKTGEYWRKITYRNLGRSTHHGTRLRLTLNEPVYFQLNGAISARTSPSRPRGVV